MDFKSAMDGDIDNINASIANDALEIHDCKVIQIPFIYKSVMNCEKWTMWSKFMYGVGLIYCPFCGVKLESESDTNE